MNACIDADQRRMRVEHDPGGREGHVGCAFDVYFHSLGMRFLYPLAMAGWRTCATARLVQAGNPVSNHVAAPHITFILPSSPAHLTTMHITLAFHAARLARPTACVLYCQHERAKWRLWLPACRLPHPHSGTQARSVCQACLCQHPSFQTWWTRSRRSHCGGW